MIPNPSDSELPPLPAAGARRHDVLCLGLNACDHLCPVERFPARGGKLRAREMLTMGGGQAATAACALARLGWRVAYAGVAGDDEAGRRARPWLEEFGVDPVGLVELGGVHSQEAFILVEPDGERTIVWRRDEACRLAPEMVDPGLVAGARVLHLDGHFLEASRLAADLARAAGTLVTLDGERIFPGSRELAGACQVVMGSQDYPQRLTGENDPGRALAALKALGPVWAGRTLGARGAELVCGAGRRRVEGFKVPVVDTTGAGDVFHAGMVHALLLGQGPEEALRTANALAALSVTGLGGRSRLATREELDAFLAARP